MRRRQRPLTPARRKGQCEERRRGDAASGKAFDGSRWALHFHAQKINLHQAGREFEPKAATPTPGSADLCFIVSTPLADVIAHLGECGVRVLEGPVRREGATGTMQSVYVRDPDGNLVELSTYVDLAESRA